MPPRAGDLDRGCHHALVIPIGEAMVGPARQVCRALRAQGRAAEAPYAAAKVGKAFKAAEQAGAREVSLVGPDEWKDGKVKRKDLASGTEELVVVAEL